MQCLFLLKIQHMGSHLRVTCFFPTMSQKKWFMVCGMTFYGAAAFVLHCPLLWPLRGFPHFEHVYVFRLWVASFTAGWTIDCSSASVEEKIKFIAWQCQPLNETLSTERRKSRYLWLIDLITALRTQLLTTLIAWLIQSFSNSSFQFFILHHLWNK